MAKRKKNKARNTSKNKTGLNMSNRHKDSYVGAFKSWLGVKSPKSYGSYYGNIEIIDADSYARDRGIRADKKGQDQWDTTANKL